MQMKFVTKMSLRNPSYKNSVIEGENMSWQPIRGHGICGEGKGKGRCVQIIRNKNGITLEIKVLSLWHKSAMML